MTQTLRVVAAVIVVDGTVLACRRSPGKSAGGQWEFPGGKVEIDETPADALVREIKEELSTSIVVGELLDRSVTALESVAIDLSCYAASLVDTAPTHSIDHDALRWVSRAELDDLEWAEPDLPMVRLLHRILP